MKMLTKAALLAGAVGLALTAMAPAQADQKPLKILASSPQMAFPFFVHMFKQIQDAQACAAREPPKRTRGRGA